ncbi:MAG TPA: DUF3857 domain-containing protein [Puia sp.]|nr:DUF3857 domain-containing protein [Puia sp.]
MKRFLSVLPVILIAAFTAKGQADSIETEQWNAKPALHSSAGEYTGEPAVVIADDRRFEYIDDVKGDQHLFYTRHRIVHVNNDHGIEYFNKVYIPADGVLSFKEIHARTILPGGKVVELSNESIKDIRDDDGHAYKIFAMEGLEKGSEIEYYYTAEREVSYFGNEVFQYQFPVQSSSLEIVCPQRLVFEVKAYNCDPDNRKDSLPGGKTVFRSRLTGLSGAQEEKYAAYSVNLARLEYKLSYNNSAGRVGQRLFTWNEFVKRAYSMYTTLTSKEAGRVSDLVRQKNWGTLKEDSEKIIAVETYVKSNFAYRDDADSRDLEKILKNKIADLVGLMRLYTAIFNELQVKYEFLFAADRTSWLIDRNFENWNNCDYPLFYFPASKGYLVPTKIDCRYPLIYPDWAGANGIFCKTVSIGSMTTAIADIRPIPLEDYSRTYNNLDIRVSLNQGLDSLLIDSRSILGGYAAIGYREPFIMATDEQKRDMFKQMSKNQLNTESIVKSEVENLSFEDANKSKPFIIHQVVLSGDMIERAGEKILVKLGLVIGPQTEMYQEKKRTMPITMAYPHFEERKIHFTIPAGYHVKNPGDLNIKQVYEENGVQTMGFVSSYQMRDNVIEIEIMEDYRKVFYPVSQYEEFAKIINASSDFNKVILVLEKN